MILLSVNFLVHSITVSLWLFLRGCRRTVFMLAVPCSTVWKMSKNNNNWGKKTPVMRHQRSKHSRIVLIKWIGVRPPQEVKAEKKINSCSAYDILQPAAWTLTESTHQLCIKFKAKMSHERRKEVCELWPLLPWIVQNQVGRSMWRWPTLPQQGRQAG